jgi:hypothetical protein
MSLGKAPLEPQPERKADRLAARLSRSRADVDETCMPVDATATSAVELMSFTRNGIRFPLPSGNGRVRNLHRQYARINS